MKEVGDKVLEKLNDELFLMEIELGYHIDLYYEKSMTYSEKLGIEEAKQEIAEKMLKDNMAIDKIIKYTELSEEEILKLK